MIKKAILSALAILSCLAVGCGSGNKKDNASDTFRICYSTSFGSAPLQLMMLNGGLENALPDNVEVEWININTSNTARDALAAEQVDIAVIGSTSVIMSMDNGMPLTILGNSTIQSSVFFSNSPDITSIDDIKENNKISIHSLGTPFHMAVMLYCKENYGDSNKLDNNLIVMQNADVITSLKVSNDLDGAILGFPFNKMTGDIDTVRKIWDFTPILRDNELGIFVITNQGFFDNNSKIVDVFTQVFSETLDYINENPKEASQILSDYYGNISAEDIEEQFIMAPPKFTISESAYNKITEIMYEVGLITNQPQKFADLPNYEDIPKTE